MYSQNFITASKPSNEGFELKFLLALRLEKMSSQEFNLKGPRLLAPRHAAEANSHSLAWNTAGDG